MFVTHLAVEDRARSSLSLIRFFSSSVLVFWLFRLA